MFNDIERKVYRIILNRTTFGRNITIDDLMIKTGRSKEGIFSVLESLSSQGIIKWNRSIPNEINLN